MNSCDADWVGVAGGVVGVGVTVGSGVLVGVAVGSLVAVTVAGGDAVAIGVTVGAGGSVGVADGRTVGVVAAGDVAVTCWLVGDEALLLSGPEQAASRSAQATTRGLVSGTGIDAATLRGRWH